MSFFSVPNQNTASANNKVARETMYAGNSVRVASNKAQMASAALSRFVQTVNNNKVLRAGAANLATASQNFNRSVNSARSQEFGKSVEEAEQVGAAIAAQSASGVSSTASDAINYATGLRSAMGREAATRRLGYVASDQEARLSSMASDIIGGLDSSTIGTDLDYRLEAPQYEAKLSTGNITARVVGNMVASYLGQGGGVGNDNGKPKTKYGKALESKSGEDLSTSRYERAVANQETKAAGASFEWRDADELAILGNRDKY